MQTLSSSLRSKLRYVAYGICCALGIIIFRLAHLQIHLMHDLFRRGQKNFLRYEKIQSPRGNILDRNGTLLVTNRPVTDLYWQGTGNKSLKNYTALLKQLADIIDKPLLEDDALLDTLKTTERLHKKFLLASDLSFDQLSKLEELFPNHDTIKLVTQFERFYPYKTYASHILGYLSYLNFEAIGTMGLEKLFEDTLRGVPGSNLKTINSFGRNLQEIEQKKALTGGTIQTTLDIELQNIIETIFPASQAGTIIVMDPTDGDILALVSRPNFDPSIFLHPIATKDWQELQEKRPFINRAFSACYPPGSLFKLVSMSAMLEHNFISPDDTIYCRGYSTFCNGEYYCARRHGHGALNAVQALALSCNIPFFEAGKKLDINLLAAYAHLFGLGEKTNIIFNEKEGLIPTRQWKLKTKHERWWQGETLSAAIGQSFLLVTPIQIARMISSIFTGFLTTPRILHNEEIKKTTLPLKASTLSFLRKSMKSVITQGTGSQVNRVKDIEIYAKTSTAQTSRYEKRELGTAYMEHGWFAAYFKYKNNKPLTVVILIENIGSSREATAVAKDLLIAYKKLMDARYARGASF